MKGSLKTHELLSAVLKRDSGLRSGRRLTHTFLFDVLRMRKLLALTDAAVNVAPTAATKMECLANALSVMRALGVDRPKVALLAAVEVVREQLRSTLDAQEIAAKANVDERFAGAVIEGPMALDVALSDASASRKGIASEVAGDPDVLLAPNLDAGSLLYKSLVHLGQAQCAGVVLGSSVPIALTGRVDSVFSRVASVALASVVRNAA